MVFTDLPLDIFQIIIDILIDVSTRRAIYRLREVNSVFAQQVEGVYMRRWTKWVETKVIVTKPIMHQKNKPSEAEAHARLLNALLSPRDFRCSVLSILRPPLALLMNTAELRFPDIIGETAVVSEGFFEDHTDAPSQARFKRIADFMTATVLCSEGPDKTYAFFSATRAMGWFWRGSSWNPIEWALATAVFMEDITAVRALLCVRVCADPYEGAGPLMERSVRLSEYLKSPGRAYISHSLCLAVKKCSYDMVLFLLEHRADVNERSPHPPYYTALEVACHRGSLRLVTLILSPRWELNDHCKEYARAIQGAARCCCSHRGIQECDERIAIIKLLTNNKDIEDLQTLRRNVLSEACAWGCPKITRMMLDAGADPNSRAKYSTPALIRAAFHGHVELMELLLERGARHLSIFFPTNKCRFWEEAANPAMMSYLSDRDATLTLALPLEQAKADFILKIAAQKNCAKVVKLLIGAGFDLRIGNRGAEALQDALSNDSAAVVEVLKSQPFLTDHD